MFLKGAKRARRAHRCDSDGSWCRVTSHSLSHSSQIIIQIRNFWVASLCLFLACSRIFCVLHFTLFRLSF
ncbi:unnamed protein product [Acanthoscelides obtectus]|uniref:Uncharacterized protein n=1 Tax=Acanthoscelides obtectus TaxID=200917 RepID=A0A9P0JQ11_ACAOB|nr:unnamed protein product [Acanthoscelides obtectus]CAK1621173.1 hypothetical protein AOBTE_LOCUS809 [Acanthoscelides obtectus]